MIARHRTDMHFYDENGQRHDFEALEVSTDEGHYWVQVDPYLMGFPEYREAMIRLAEAGLERTLGRWTEP